MRWYPIFVSISGICPDGTCTFCSYINISHVILFSFARPYPPLDALIYPGLSCFGIAVTFHRLRYCCFFRFVFVGEQYFIGSSNMLLQQPAWRPSSSQKLGFQFLFHSQDPHTPVDFLRLLCSDLSLSRSVLVGKICMKSGCFQRMGVILKESSFCRPKCLKTSMNTYLRSELFGKKTFT